MRRGLAIKKLAKSNISEASLTDDRPLIQTRSPRKRIPVSHASIRNNLEKLSISEAFIPPILTGFGHTETTVALKTHEQTTVMLSPVQTSTEPFDLRVKRAQRTSTEG